MLITFVHQLRFFFLGRQFAGHLCRPNMITFVFHLFVGLGSGYLKVSCDDEGLKTTTLFWCSFGPVKLSIHCQSMILDIVSSSGRSEIDR